MDFQTVGVGLSILGGGVIFLGAPGLCALFFWLVIVLMPLAAAITGDLGFLAFGILAMPFAVLFTLRFRALCARLDAAESKGEG